MLTIKQITENTEAVLRGLEKKHFKKSGGPVRPGLRDTILMYQKCREIMGQVLEPGAI